MPDSVPSIPELLAPAGDVESLRAAVSAGADAVFLGLEDFNARRGARNFTLDTLEQACRFAHLRGVRVYLTANIAVLPDEMSAALSMIDSAWASGVDAVIVADLGLLRVLRLAMPYVRIHASTQMNVHSADSVRVLAERGVSRVTLARETSLDEIATLVAVGRDAGVEIESFVHGALCVSYSGQCLMSSMVGGRSANRGQCAQPCRLPYELLDGAGETRSDVGAHLLSPKDLAGIGLLPEFARIGVAALKIEGRMKSPDYVALVTGVYRSALDRSLEHPEEFAVREGEMSVLSEAFSRGFTQAYLHGESGNDMMSYRRPNNRGVALGRVLAARGGRATVSLEAAVDAGDTIEIWTSQGRLTRQVGLLEYEGGEHTSAAAATKAEISVDGTVSAGDRVFRVRNASLSAAAARSYAEPQGDPIPLAISVCVVIGQPLRVSVVDSLGRSGAIEGPTVELARTRAVTADEIAEHVGRLGGTPYSAGSWDIELSPRAGVRFSALHAARRDALSDYEASVLTPWQSRRTTSPRVPTIGRGRRSRGEGPRVVALVGDLEAARVCLDAGADEVQLVSGGADLSVGDAAIVPVVPRVLHDRDRERVMGAALQAGRAVAGSVGALRALASAGCDVQAHWSLNALNSHTVQELADLGAGFVWLSPELTLRQLGRVSGDSSVPTGIAVAGRQELMVTEHCVLMAEGSCARSCVSCARRREVRVLKDRKGYRFPVVTDMFGRTHLYNSIPLDLTAVLHEVLATGVSALRLDLEVERPARAGAEVARVRAALSLAQADAEVRKPHGPITSGHAFRGVG